MTGFHLDGYPVKLGIHLLLLCHDVHTSDESKLHVKLCWLIGIRE